MTLPVTVIVPNYNHERFIQRRLQSIRDQTYKDFEVLILDDASTDASVRHIKQFLHNTSDTRFKLLDVNSRNSGSTFSQWNKGVSQASGEIIWIAESDDASDPRFLETLLPAFEKPNVVLAYCQSLAVTEEDKVMHSLQHTTKYLSRQHWKHPFYRPGPLECGEYLFIRNTIPNASAVVFRKQAFLVAGRAPENMKICGDWMLWAKILFQGELFFSPQPFNYFRHHTQSVRKTTRPEQLYTETCQVKQFIVAQVPIPSRTVGLAKIEAIRDFWRLSRSPIAPSLEEALQLAEQNPQQSRLKGLSVLYHLAQACKKVCT